MPFCNLFMERSSYFNIGLRTVIFCHMSRWLYITAIVETHIVAHTEGLISGAQHLIPRNVSKVAQPRALLDDHITILD